MSTTKKKTTKKKVAKKKTTTQKAGRPAGSKNNPVDTVEAKATRCKECGSTEREKYFNRREFESAGVDVHTGEPYTHTVWRRTKCMNCGQHRVDRHRENRKSKK